ncbi:MAG: hypothetical protein AAF215_35640 [Cyanobacteria bacterium P01_A01_bin.123]
MRPSYEFYGDRSFLSQGAQELSDEALGKRSHLVRCDRIALVERQS